MILQALARYYDILSAEANASEDSNVAQPGYSVANVSYALNLSTQGDLLDIFPLSQQVQRGKKMVDKPLSMIVPEQAGRSGRTPPAYFLCDNNAYVLGISVEDEDKPEYSQQRLEAFRAYNKEILAGANCIEAKAVIAFLDKYEPVTGRKNPVIAKFLDDILKIGKANFVFMVDGKYVHKNAEIRQVWEARNKSSEDSYIGQCLITGEIAPIARIHDIKIKGIAPYYGGVALVGFNDRAYESYNRTNGQGLNSPVSKKAMLAYSKALNHLLSDANENKKIVIGDTTVVYWAEGNNKACASLFAGLTEMEFEEPASDLPEGAPIRDQKGENLLRNIAEKIKSGEKIDKEGLAAEVDWNTRFYVLGLEAPNRGRASIRFFYSDPFIKFVQRIGEHYSDLQLGESEKPIKIRWILNETVSKKAREGKIAPLLTGAVFSSMLTNSPYPAALYNAIMIRISADMDDEDNQIQKINRLRAAVIKAYLIRKYRNQPQHPIQEVLVMSLNEQSTIPAYLLGRIFAVLEKVQQEAIGDMNASIKDRYFTSACASPRTVFPTLLRLSQHWISKAEYGYASENRIEKIMNLLDIEKNPFPSHLTLDEQGIFVLGYYHQRTAFYVKNSAAAETTETKTN
jgi:CRISPR-associated protein Csd1